MQTTTTTETETSSPSKAPVVITPAPIVEVPKSSIDAADRRRDWALYVLTGGGMAMTLYSAVAMYILQNFPGYVFWLGMFAMANILVLFTGIAGLLVKRSLSVSRQGVTIKDDFQQGSDNQPS